MLTDDDQILELIRLLRKMGHSHPVGRAVAFDLGILGSFVGA